MSSPTASLRVLLVEDSDDDAILTTRELSRGWPQPRFDVRHVASLGAALELPRSACDVILLDLALPDGSGLSALGRLLREFTGVPIVVLTANNDLANAISAVQAGAQDYLYKEARLGDALPRALLYAVERSRAQDTLARREQQLADAQAIAHLGSWERDLETQKTTWSPELFRLFGVAPATFEPSFARFLAEIVHPDDLARVSAIWEQSRTTHHASPHEHRIVRPNGEVRTVFSRSTCFFGPGGVPRRFAGTYLDITERKLMESQIALAGRLAAAGTLAAGVAHEINSPLASVIGNIDFVSEVLRRAHPEAHEACGSALEDAHTGAFCVSRIVRDLKELTRVDGEARGRVRVAEVLESALNVASAQVRPRAQIHRDLGPVPEVEAVASRLMQVFVHLIVNAAQALEGSPNTPPTLGLVTYTAADGSAVVEVSDNGVGISAANRDHVFDPFFTTRPIGTATGIGLASAHAIVSALGGTISFDSVPGRGTTFRVTLPMVRPRTGLPAPPRARGTPGLIPRILVIDDEPLIGKTIRRLLAHGHHVEVEAEAGPALARLVAGEQFDLILCDLMMPRMNGAQFFSKLQERAPHHLECLVFMTGGAAAPELQEFLAAVTRPLLEKPFRPDQIIAFVSRFVARASS